MRHNKTRHQPVFVANSAVEVAKTLLSSLLFSGRIETRHKARKKINEIKMAIGVDGFASGASVCLQRGSLSRRIASEIFLLGHSLIKKAVQPAERHERQLSKQNRSACTAAHLRHRSKYDFHSLRSRQRVTTCTRAGFCD